MSIESIIATLYFVIGLVLMFYWWDKEYNDSIKNDEDVEEPMVILFMWTLVILWPIKLIKNLTHEI